MTATETQDWAVALDTQLRLYEWWGTRDGKKYGDGFGEALVSRYLDSEVDKGRDITDVMRAIAQNNTLAGLEIVEHERTALGSGDTYYVSAEMSAFAGWAAQGLPSEADLRPSLLPGPRGFVFIEDGIPLRDRRGDTYIVKAVSWSTDAESDEYEAEGVQGVDVALYSDPLDERETDPSADQIRDEQSDVRRELTIPPLWLFHASAMRYGRRTWPGVEDIGPDDVLPGDVGLTDEGVTVTEEMVVEAVADVIAMERWLVSFWLLVDTPLTTTDHRFPRRALRRRFDRAVPVAPDETTVRVVTLRREVDTHPPHATDDDAPAVAWSHRWWSRPHWRRLHKGTPDERLTLVRGSIKGPEDAPLILRDTCFRWVR